MERYAKLILNESIFRSSSCIGFSSDFDCLSFAANATSCRRSVTSLSWIGVSSEESSESDSFIPARILSAVRVRDYERHAYMRKIPGGQWLEYGGKSDVQQSFNWRSRSFVMAIGCLPLAISLCTMSRSSSSRF